MSSYQIADLERLTGIKAHTIRIWEKRYGLIAPQRTSTNIRYYDDAQARKLLKVATLAAQGFKISKISGLTEKEINEQISQIHHSSTQDVISLAFINELISSMLTFDEGAFERTYSAAVVRFGMYTMMLRVIYPFLRKTGLMWEIENAMPIQEHFATAIIRRKLISAIDGLPAPSRRSKTFVLFLPEGEWHETGLMLADYMIRSKGFKTIYLAQNVPANNLSEIVLATQPTHLLTLYISRQEPETMLHDLEKICKQFPALQLLIAGNVPNAAVPRRAKNFQVLTSPEDLLKII